MMKLLSIHKPSSRTSERKRARSGIHVGAWRQAARSFARSLPFFNVMSGLDTGIQGDRSVACPWTLGSIPRSEEHTSELQSLMRISYAVSCLKKKKTPKH